MPIEKIFASQSTVANMLQNGMIDLAITFPPITGENVQNQVLIHDPLRLAVASGHPLLKQMRVTLEDPQPYPLHIIKEDTEFHSLITGILRKKDVSLKLDEQAYADWCRLVDEGRNGGKLISITIQKQFALAFGKGYRSISIQDLPEAQVTSISWLSDSMFPYEHKGLLDMIAKGYDRIYYFNYKKERLL